MKNTTQGFTLIELLIVIAIIGILAAVLIPNLLNARTRANDTAAEGYGRQIKTYAESYLSASTANKVAGIGTDCMAPNAALQAEGAPAAAPASVKTCTIKDNGDETYTITGTAASGKAFKF